MEGRWTEAWVDKMKKMTKKQAFLNAFELIKNPDTFTVKAAARTSDGETCDPSAPDAVCWCSLGAAFKVATPYKHINGEHYSKFVDNLLIDLDKEACKFDNGILDITDFNDIHPHEDVIKVWESVGRKNRWIK